jgi:hypothetical protein
MKNLLLSIAAIFFISQTNAQGPVEIDVWKKEKRANRSKNVLKVTDLPREFSATLPSGKSIIYEKWDRPDVNVETSTGKKIKYKPNIYKSKSKDVHSVISYDGNKWDGMESEDGKESYSLSSDSVIKDTSSGRNLNYDDVLISDTPPPNDKKLKKLKNTKTSTPEVAQSLPQADFYNPLIRINKRATVYVEVTNALHMIWGSNLSTSISNVTIIMNNVAAFFDREGITLENNHIYIWETPDPYRFSDNASDNLYLFRDNITAGTPTSTTSHFRHLFTSHSYGGIAFFPTSLIPDGYQVPNPKLSTYNAVGVSGINNKTIINSSTTYSWPVSVVAHELGHNLGSQHTHWCGWKNDQGVSIGRIDSCSADQPVSPCGSLIKRNNSGTIMSYCHINGAVDLNLGFGRYPRFSIRANLYLAPEIPFENVVFPTLTTNTISSITPTSSISGGVISNDGGAPITSSGVCWATTQNPTISNSKTSDGTLSSFTSNITGLSHSTTYYVRAWATNVSGTGYGPQRTFTTSAPTIPIVTTSSATLVGGTLANIGGNVTNTGGLSVTSRGVCWSTAQNPTVDLSTKTSDGTGSGVFTSSITGLSISTTYYIRAYATNSLGTAYGSQVTITTTSSLLPIVSTNTTVSNFRNYGVDGNPVNTLFADCGGNVTNIGGSAVTARGLCWSSSTNPPTISNSKTTNGSGVGTFNSIISGLLRGTTYYMRAYATNSSGTSYGDLVTFTTPSSPTVSMNSISNINSSGATFNGTLSTSLKAYQVLFMIGLTPGGSNFSAGSIFGYPNFSSGVYQYSISNQLSPNTTYYVRMESYSDVNFNSPSKSNELTFTTSGPSLPTVITSNFQLLDGCISSNGSTQPPRFRSVCNVTANGGSTVTERGLCISTSPNPTTSNTKFISGSGLGSYTITTPTLLPNVTYYARAYAINSSGTAYGNEISSICSVTILTTLAATNITSTSATLGGSAVVAAGQTLADRGILLTTGIVSPLNSYEKFCIASNQNPWSCPITGLLPNTTYSYVCYTDGTNKTGNTLTFTTSPASTGLPNVTTTSISSITSTTATGGGNVTSIGGSAVTARGICWSTSQNPTVALSTKTSDGTGFGSFTSSITGLTASTLYYVRAYATNSSGTAYGSQVSFTSLSGATPTVTTTSISSITSTTATGGGNVTSIGGSAVTARGICWSTSQNPTVALTTKTTNGSGTGSFTSSITGLTSSTLYYVRAYATNTAGTAYGSQVSFTTLSNLPTLSTTTASSITLTSAVSGGNITSDGGSAVTIRGVCWSTTQNPTIALTTKTSNGTGTGSFTSNLTNLSPGTVYYIRAYATNSAGTNYGSQVSFNTISPTPPTVTTTSISSITTTSATSGGNVTSDGNATVTSRGVCWSTEPSPTISLSTKTTDGTGTGPFTSSITELSPGTTYYVRAYATNSSGTAYGIQVSFVTNQLPEVSTDEITNITPNGADVLYTLNSLGGGSLSEKGIVYSTTPGPTTSGLKLSEVCDQGQICDDNGQFTARFIGQLSPNTTYYVRGFAITEFGTSYGGELSFTTLIDLPTVTTSTISSITINSAVGGGSVTNVGGGIVSGRGICWSTSQDPTIALSTKTSNGTGLGSFTSNLTNLSPGTVYYVRAYATNESGTSYGSQVSFTTTSIGLPVLTTSSVSSITTTTATSGGSISSDGGSAVTVRGVCWSTNINPTTGSSITSNGTGTGSFTSSITGLTPGTVYYVRAYATNGAGTSYGNQVSFTSSTSVATLTTTSISGITSSSASSGGNITNSGGSTITSRGVVWSTSINPIVSLSTKTNDGTGTGIFTSNISGLLPSTTYYVRSYATNTQGTAYGNQLSFTTLPSTGGSCIVSNLSAYKNANNQWVFKFNINSNCSSYTVNVCRYNLSNPSVQPTLTTTAVACGVRNSMSSYVPSTAERTDGFIERVMSPQPSLFGFWYSVDIKCNAASCTGTNTTKFFFFRQ